MEYVKHLARTPSMVHKDRYICRLRCETQKRPRDSKTELLPSATVGFKPRFRIQLGNFL
jgi:hypothetical protein